MKSNDKKKKKYSKEVRKIVKNAMKFAKQKRKEGWTKDQAAESLKKMFESDTGETE